MNVKDKVRDAIRNYEKALADEANAEKAVKDCGTCRASVTGELIRQMRLHFPKNSILYGGHRYAVRQSQSGALALDVRPSDAILLD